MKALGRPERRSEAGAALGGSGRPGRPWEILVLVFKRLNVPHDASLNV